MDIRCHRWRAASFCFNSPRGVICYCSVSNSESDSHDFYPSRFHAKYESREFEELIFRL